MQCGSMPHCIGQILLKLIHWCLMSTIRAYQFALQPRPAQLHVLARLSGSLRWLWNHALAEQQRRYQAGEKYSNYVAMATWLTAWRNSEEFGWLAQGAIHPQQQCLKRLDKAFQRFFEKAGGYPKFKRRGEDPGIRFPDAKQFAVDQVHGRIKLPKLGFVRLRQSQTVEGVAKNVSVRKHGRRWLCSVQVEIPTETMPALGLDVTLGIDLGTKNFAALAADENPFTPARLVKGLDLDEHARRLKRYQRSVSRKCKGSKNRRKAIDKLSRLHQRLADQRKDFINKLTTQLADRHPVIAVEDLKIKNMSASAKGTAEQPGKNVRQKAGLNRSILKQGWGEFLRQLNYKLKWRGGQLVKVNPAYTSQMCCSCGHTAAENRKTQEKFKCVACGHAEHADSNAAKNIRAAGRAVWELLQATAAAPQVCGEDVRRVKAVKPKRAASAKQKPAEGLP